MRKKSVVMTPVEIRFMEALWKKKQASVGEITKELASKAPTAYSTALTMLRIMEQKGYVNHTKQGRAFIYYPLIDRQGARSSAIRNMLSSLFDNSPELLMLNILKDEKVSAEQLENIRKMIDEAGE